MDITCNRCHQSVPADSCYCPACGLPQLVYSNEDGAGAVPAERWTEAVRDASSVEWKPALRAAMLLAVPAGFLSCGFSPVGPLGLFWMAAASAWAVSLYVRKQRPAWITMGAGARIGLVTGLMAGWLAFSATGLAMFSKRYFLHQGQEFDDTWRAMDQSLSQQLQTMNSDPQAVASFKKMMFSSEGHIGLVLATALLCEVVLLVFAAAGGAIGARLTARTRRPEI
jgi:hypothetical protein